MKTILPFLLFSTLAAANTDMEVFTRAAKKNCNSSKCVEKNQMKFRQCKTQSCRDFLVSAENFKLRYCKGDESLLSYRLNCYQSVDKIVIDRMKDSKIPLQSLNEFWSSHVKQGMIYIPKNKRSSF